MPNETFEATVISVDRHQVAYACPNYPYILHSMSLSDVVEFLYNGDRAILPASVGGFVRRDYVVRCVDCDDAICCDCFVFFPSVDHVPSTPLCPSCQENRSWCSTCSTFLPYEAAHDCDVCGESYCDDDDHDCSRIHCCESERPDFRIARPEGEPIVSDTPFALEIPDDMPIPNDTLDGIWNMISCELGLYPLDLDLAVLTDDDGPVGPLWITKRGTFPKRLSSYIYKAHGTKIPSDLLSRVGDMARTGAIPAGTVNLEITRRLNEGPKYFAHEESCWWGSYGESRCLLKQIGGFGLRSLPNLEPCNSDPEGRAWVVPVARRDDSPTPWLPSHEDDADGWLLFNGYGGLAEYRAVRLWATVLGLSYKKIDFYADHMYVNSHTGYLASRQDLLDGAMRVYWTSRDIGRGC